MPDTMTKKRQDSSISAEDVIEFLKNDPHFLSKHPEICNILVPPKQHQDKNVADFQQYMVKHLREDRDGIIEEAKELIELSRANMKNLTRVHRAVIMLLEAQSFEDFIHVITMDLTALLDVDISSLIVETEGDVVPHINITGVRAVMPGTVQLLMKDKQVTLESSITGFEEIYGGAAGLVKSQNLLRLNVSPNVPPIMVAFGSRDPEMFQPGQGTEQIIFLGQVIERCFRTWLELPR